MTTCRVETSVSVRAHGGSAHRRVPLARNARAASQARIMSHDIFAHLRERTISALRAILPELPEEAFARMSPEYRLALVC